MKKEHVALKSLREHPGWPILENEWLWQVTKIEEARDRAAKKAQESAWRYWAGQEAGFKLAMTALSRALEKLESQGDDQPVPEYDALLREIKGETV